MTCTTRGCAAFLTFAAFMSPPVASAADNIEEAFSEGTTYFDFRLRYEGVDQEGDLDNAEALTLRSRLGFVTAPVQGISARIEFEDSRSVFGVDDYSVPASGYKPGEYPVVGDPESTEVDQAYLQYENNGFLARGGRQVINLDNARFVGDVGWRQDRQTFDAVSVAWSKDMISLSYQYLDQRNRIFADDADIDSSDHLLHGAYKIAGFGELSAYGYLLEDDDLPYDNSIDTYGLRFAGERGGDIKISYELEYARQDTERGSDDYDADYYLAALGVKYSLFTVKAGYEVLGSDDGQYGFSTPLATLHKFNGWADMFLSTPDEGLTDTYLSITAAIGPGNLTATYHDFNADEDSVALDELGSEVDVSYAMKFGKHYQVGLKYAAYNADDYSTDTDKWWLWASASF
ncbi:MAG: alginate export family protein [Parahaliea sp.]